MEIWHQVSIFWREVSRRRGVCYIIFIMSSRRFIKNIAFFGYADFKEEDQPYRDAFKIAQLLAKKGYTIVNGGGPGIMNAATQGAESVGGKTIAVTFSPKNAPGFEGRYLANRVDKEIKTANYIDRMFKLMEHSDCFIIFKGGTGTVSEFGTAWVLARLYYPYHKPFILYGDFWRPIVKVLREKLMIRDEAMKVFKIVDNKEEVSQALVEFEEETAKLDKKTDKFVKENVFMLGKV